MNEKTEVEKLKDVKSFIDNRRHDLIITRVPVKTLEIFRQFANDEFSGRNGIGDYGMALKELVDSYFKKNITSDMMLELSMRIHNIEDKLDGLDDKKKDISLMSGKVIKR